jgi:DNA-3-methyladenine glycosylase II
VTSAPEAQRNHRVSPTAAAGILATRDPVIARLIADTGPPRFRRPQESPFAALVRAIVYQQLAGAAASAIHGRLVTALNDDVQPQGLLTLSDATLRAVGLSANKVASLRDLATKVTDGTVVLSPRGLARQIDEEVIARLSSVRGIGRWTADMFLMFQLRRLDVWPTGDLGVRRGYGLAWKIPMPSAKELEPLGDSYRPYRSVVAWYCWRAAELYAGSADSAMTR